MEPLVSIIIPVYNAENTIDKCVESIVFGEYKNIEIILVDDCSKDRSWEKCKMLEQKFSMVRALQNEINMGVSATRNNGISLASGTYMAFVDSDDWVSGKYIRKLMDCQNLFSDSFVMCGIRFLDYTSGVKRDYIWDSSGRSFLTIPKEHYFELIDKLIIQSPCNKLFDLRLVKKNNLCFRIDQKMGEDFQFVLDYLSEAKPDQCIVINSPLYYYIRYNRNSLMGSFGLVEQENEFKRLDQLRQICEESGIDVSDNYKDAIENSKRNYLYQICRSSLSNREKEELIKKIYKSIDVNNLLLKQSIGNRKERIAQKLLGVLKLRKKIARRISNQKNRILIGWMKRRLSVHDFSLISQNCIGGVLYHDMGMEFLSPTINLYFSCPDFLKFVSNLNEYLEKEMILKWEEEYPIGILGDITIHFMHYDTCTEAQESWDRRKARINWNRIVVLITDTESFGDPEYETWKSLNYPKLLFTANDKYCADSIIYPNYKRNKKVKNLIPKREFYRKGILINIINSLQH